MYADDGEALSFDHHVVWICMQLYCAGNTPAKDTLDVWPALPLIVSITFPSSTTDNIIVALRQSRRVYKVDFNLAGGKLEKVLAVMQVPFPELTSLLFLSNDKRWRITSHSRFFPGWICSTSAIPRLGWRFISGIVKSAFIRYSTRQPWPL